MFQHSALPAHSVDLPTPLPRIGLVHGLARLDELIPLPQTFSGFLLWTLAMLLVTSLALLQVWTTLRISVARAELADLKLEYSLIDQQNAELLWQIGQHTTLERVKEAAVAQGFRQALKRKYIHRTPDADSRAGPTDSAASPADGVDTPGALAPAQRPLPPPLTHAQDVTSISAPEAEHGSLPLQAVAEFLRRRWLGWWGPFSQKLFQGFDTPSIRLSRWLRQ